MKKNNTTKAAQKTSMKKLDASTQKKMKGGYIYLSYNQDGVDIYGGWGGSDAQAGRGAGSIGTMKY